MKGRYTTILTITFALVLFSSVAYAIEKKKQTKLVDRTPETITEEEALRAELLEATEEHKNVDDILKRIDDDKVDEMKDKLKINNIAQSLKTR